MLDPDVTDLLTDPDLGGGIPFTVTRRTYARQNGDTTLQTEAVFTHTGNVQFSEPRANQPTSTEDQYSQSVTIRSTFAFQAGHDEGATFTGADVVSVFGRIWRVTRIEDWTPWGFTIATATLRRLAGDDP